MLKYVVIVTLLSAVLGVKLPLQVKHDLVSLNGKIQPDFYISTGLSLGTPLQRELKFRVDTTSADLQVNLCPYGVVQYGCYWWFESSTFVNRTDHTASDSIFNGVLDAVIFPNITFGYQVKTKTDGFTGTLGLAWPAASNNPGQTYYPVDWMNGTLERVFSMKIGLYECTTTFELGSASICQESPETTVYVPITSKKYWQFALETVKIGSLVYPQQSQAVFDTTKENIGLPKQFLDQFTQKHGILWDGLYQAYTVDCGLPEKLPDLELHVDGGKVLKIKAKYYIYTYQKLPNGKCLLNMESSANGFGSAWYFSFHLITDYCASFDYDKKRIGFTVNTEDYNDC